MTDTKHRCAASGRTADLASMHDVTYLRSTNNIPVALVDRHGLSRTYVGFFIRGGAAYEEKNERGGFHLLEHMLFRGYGEVPQAQIDERFSRLGAAANGCTSSAMTVVSAMVRHSNVAACVEQLARMVAMPAFRENDLEIERGVVLQEAASYVDKNGRQAGANERLHELACPGRFGRPVCGTPDDVLALSAARLRSLHRRHYNAGNMAVVVVGPIDDGVRAALAESLRCIPAGEAVSPRQASMRQGSMRVVDIHDEGHDPSVWLGFHVPSWQEPDGPEISLLAEVLGNGPMGRLWHRTRGDTGLAYQAAAFQSQVSEATDLLVVQAMSEPDGLSTVARVLFEETARLCDELVAVTDLGAAAERVDWQMRLWDDEPEQLADAYGSALLAGRKFSVRGYCDAILDVGPNRLRSVARRWLARERLNMVMAGDIDSALRGRLTARAESYRPST